MYRGTPPNLKIFENGPLNPRVIHSCLNLNLNLSISYLQITFISLQLMQIYSSFLYIFCFLIFSSTSYNISHLEFDKRTATLYYPDFDIISPPSLPLVFAFHGLGHNTDDIIDSNFHLISLVDQFQFILVYPHGTLGLNHLYGWKAGFCCVFNPEIDDLSFTQEMVHFISNNYPVDTQRIFGLGHSNGAGLIHHIMCQNSALFKGYSSVSGSLFYHNVSDCDIVYTGNVNLLSIHGDNDQVVPWEGGKITGIKGYTVKSVKQTFKDWLIRNNCQHTVGQCTYNNGSFINTAHLCPSGNRIELMRNILGGHFYSSYILSSLDSSLYILFFFGVINEEIFYEYQSKYSHSSQLDSFFTSSDIKRDDNIPTSHLSTSYIHRVYPPISVMKEIKGNIKVYRPGDSLFIGNNTANNSILTLQLESSVFDKSLPYQLSIDYTLSSCPNCCVETFVKKGLPPNPNHKSSYDYVFSPFNTPPIYIQYPSPGPYYFTFLVQLSPIAWNSTASIYFNYHITMTSCSDNDIGLDGHCSSIVLKQPLGIDYKLTISDTLSPDLNNLMYVFKQPFNEYKGPFIDYLDFTYIPFSGIAPSRLLIVKDISFSHHIYQKVKEIDFFYPHTTLSVDLFPSLTLPGYYYILEFPFHPHPFSFKGQISWMPSYCHSIFESELIYTNCHNISIISNDLSYHVNPNATLFTRKYAEYPFTDSSYLAFNLADLYHGELLMVFFSMDFSNVHGLIDIYLTKDGTLPSPSHYNQHENFYFPYYNNYVSETFSVVDSSHPGLYIFLIQYDQYTEIVNGSVKIFAYGLDHYPYIYDNIPSINHTLR